MKDQSLKSTCSAAVHAMTAMVDHRGCITHNVLTGIKEYVHLHFDVSILGLKQDQQVLVLPGPICPRRGPSVYVWTESTSSSPYRFHSLQHKCLMDSIVERSDSTTNAQETPANPQSAQGSWLVPLPDRTRGKGSAHKAGSEEVQHSSPVSHGTLSNAGIDIQHISHEQFLSLCAFIGQMNITASIHLTKQGATA